MARSRVPNPKRRKIEEKENQREKEEEKETRDLLLLLLLQFPNWLNLPTDLLQLIFDLISSSIPDLLSFYAVCTSWRSLAKSSPISPPPLLLSCQPTRPGEPWPPKRSSMSHLKTLTTPDLCPSRTFRSPISKGALNRNCCGYSHGHLIFASPTATTVLIADLFSPSKILLPQPPLPPVNPPFTHGVLTGPPDSPSSTLFLIISPVIYFRKLAHDTVGKDKWSVLSLATHYYIKCLTLFNGMLHVLHTDGSAFVLELSPNPCWKPLPDARFVIEDAYNRLVECDGKLLLLCFVKTEEPSRNRIEVFKLDLEGGVWVRVQSIGDWCLFMDYIGRCPLVCRNPGKWGGERNCIYFSGPQFGRWRVLPLDGTEFEHMYHFRLLFSLDRWPSPAWVYPEPLARILEQYLTVGAGDVA